MKKLVLTFAILVALLASFVGGSWYAIRYANVSYDKAKGLHILEVFGCSEYWYFTTEEDFNG